MKLIKKKKELYSKKFMYVAIILYGSIVFLPVRSGSTEPGRPAVADTDEIRAGVDET